MHHSFRHTAAAALALLPTLAAAHPGHSAFDPTVVPHAGHSWEHAIVLGTAAGVIALVVRAFLKRRR